MLTKKGKDHHGTIRVMVVTSSHVCVSFSFGGEYPGEGNMALELIFVSARTNKSHHHYHAGLEIVDDNGGAMLGENVQEYPVKKELCMTTYALAWRLEGDTSCEPCTRRCRR